MKHMIQDTHDTARCEIMRCSRTVSYVFVGPITKVSMVNVEVFDDIFADQTCHKNLNIPVIKYWLYSSNACDASTQLF